MTSAVVLGLSAALLALLLGALVVTMRQDRKRSTAPVPQPLPGPVDDPAQPGTGRVGTDYPDPRTIKVGDTVDCPGVRARVRGALHVSWRGKQWTEYRLDDKARQYQWLSVEEVQHEFGDVPSHLEVLLWTSVPTMGMVPAKSTLIMEGVEFAPEQRGTAAFRSEGDTGHPERGLLDFAEYRAQDGRLLSFDRVQGDAWGASYASPLPPGSIKIERAPA
ncbi:hypothetical protein Misp01_26140 [Microtetraspora sp. NBRC 13810]|uniref:DUF4178 domain-containing protein n=1 Tax=Microtetraspora sp. NBRC 13810 TaxID=3030990 RepID=UPI0024A24569|nr:DUF4178 domain-containing protein [Microtetraspora sp. NBRC 13810]GLW07484.1 hypothetical protein Misp01_26140 [Microtetraspora sp. NBRC 13810]